MCSSLVSRPSAVLSTGQEAVRQGLHALIQLFTQYPPFSSLSAEEMLQLLKRGQLVFYAQGDVIASPEQGVCEQLWIVRQGMVRIASVDQAPGEPCTEKQVIGMLGVADCFPIGALMAERPTSRLYVAAEDVFCVQIAKTDFLHVLHQSESLRHFVFKGVSSLFGQLYEKTRTSAYERNAVGANLNAPLDTLLAREPITCAPEVPLREAVRQMHEQAISSIVIVENEYPIGIFTLRDLRRIVAQGESLEQPVSQVMSSQLVALGLSASVFDVALLMAKQRIGHICIIEGGRLYGVISERDVFALQRVDLVSVSRKLYHASSAAELVAVYRSVQPVLTTMQAHGADAIQLMELISGLRDHCISRAIELCLLDHPGVSFPFDWVVFGAGARAEQWLFSKQQSGIVFEAVDAEQARSRQQQLLPLAEQVIGLLQQCGMQSCMGETLASQPDYCQPVQGWQEYMQKWLEKGSARVLSKQQSLLDQRCVWGSGLVWQQVHAFWLKTLQEHDAALRRLKKTVLRYRLPTAEQLQRFLESKQFVVADQDFRKQGLRVLTQAVRVLALEQGCRDTNTLQRLQCLVQHQVIPLESAHALRQAFNYLHLLKHQQTVKSEHAPDEASTLTPLEKRLFREALRQIMPLREALEK